MSRDRSQSAEVRRVTWVALAVNVALSALKLLVGLAGRSQAVVADAVHSLSDAGTDVAILVGVRYWSAPADDTHPHGHRRIETLVTLAIAAGLGAVAIGLARHALMTMKLRHETPPGWIAFWGAALSVAAKEALFRWSAAAGRRLRSPALIANAWHHRSDGLSSIPAALAVAGARIGPSWVFLDHVGAVLVSLIIMQAVFRIGWPAIRELADAGAPMRARAVLVSLALEVDGVQAVHAVRTRYLGPALHVDLHLLVDGDITVNEGHAIAEEVGERLRTDGPEVVDVVVHVEPAPR